MNLGSVAEDVVFLRLVHVRQPLKEQFRERRLTRVNNKQEKREATAGGSDTRPPCAFHLITHDRRVSVCAAQEVLRPWRRNTSCAAHTDTCPTKRKSLCRGLRTKCQCYPLYGKRLTPAASRLPLSPPSPRWFNHSRPFGVSGYTLRVKSFCLPPSLYPSFPRMRESSRYNAGFPSGWE